MAGSTFLQGLVARLLLLGGGTLALLIGLQLGIHALAASAPAGMRAVVLLVSDLFACAVMIGAYKVGVGLLEHRTAAEISFASVSLFMPGMALGFTIFAVVYAILWAAGIAHFEGLGAVTARTVNAAAAALTAAVGEEIVFRGSIYRPIEDRFGSSIAAAVSAGIFGILHALNHGATVLSTIAIALEAGILLAAAYSAARSLWLPIGIHFGWNFTEGGVFGAAVSGGHSAGVIVVPLQGRDIYTGGAFGPEASICSVVVCLAVAGAFVIAAIRKRRWRSFADSNIKTKVEFKA